MQDRTILDNIFLKKQSALSDFVYYIGTHKQSGKFSFNYLDVNGNGREYTIGSFAEFEELVSFLKEAFQKAPK